MRMKNTSLHLKMKMKMKTTLVMKLPRMLKMYNLGGEQPINDPEGQMPGKFAPAATVQQEIRTYAQQKEAAKEKNCQKLGEEVIIHQ